MLGRTDWSEWRTHRIYDTLTDWENGTGKREKAVVARAKRDRRSETERGGSEDDVEGKREEEGKRAKREVVAVRFVRGAGGNSEQKLTKRKPSVHPDFRSVGSDTVPLNPGYEFPLSIQDAIVEEWLKGTNEGNDRVDRADGTRWGEGMKEIGREGIDEDRMSAIEGEQRRCSGCRGPAFFWVINGLTSPESIDDQTLINSVQTCRGSATKRSLAPMAAQERSSKSGGFVEFLAFHFGLAFEYLPGKTLTESNWPTFSEYTASALAALSYFSARFTINVAFNSISWRAPGRFLISFVGRAVFSNNYAGNNFVEVSLTNNPSKTGLGATSEFPTIELDSTTEKKQALWRKTQQRYKEITDHAK
ncbi:hypothetical protein WN48_03392 [Eufriesea mexicana]|uniref:Uncharacterized protein n=1 Tax=Eufriesea mexicana TaxID=516756 RepID=A0A310SPP1_9HYME|nr:hypothetical protein WN48_03392 [Eufriesea mexicana]